MSARTELAETHDSDDLCVWASSWAEKLLNANDKALELARGVAERHYHLHPTLKLEQCNNELCKLARELLKSS